MRAIDADALMRAMYERAFETDGDTMWQSGCWVRYRAIEEVVKEQPTIEPQPEIIRCKDCKHRPTSTEADGYIDGFSLEFPDNVCPCQCEDGWYNWYPSDDFYCGVAERETV